MSFLIAPTAAATMPYAIGTGVVGNMLMGSDLFDTVGISVIQGVVYAASVGFAALAATYGTMTVVGIGAGVGFVVGTGASLLRNGEVPTEAGEKKKKMPPIKAGFVGAITVVVCATLAVLGGRLVNNALGAVGQRAYTPLQPYIDKGIVWARPHLQSYVDFARAKAGY